MNKFEYLEKFDLTSQDIRELGLEGWELVTVINSKYIFKRVLEL